VLAALSTVGVQTASFVAVLGAAGLAVGLALQGSLANFAAGVLLILFRPFRVGDVVEAGGVMGKIEEVQIFTTHFCSFDNKAIIVPNAQITGGTITNFSAKPTRRVDLVFGVSYSDDLSQVKKVLEEILTQDDRVLEDPAPVVNIASLGDSSVNFNCRPWVKAEDYWDVYFDLMKTVKERFDAEGISIPFPQRDVHLFREDAAAG
jgi:small conductance mechanosensitive channel